GAATTGACSRATATIRSCATWPRRGDHEPARCSQGPAGRRPRLRGTRRVPLGGRRGPCSGAAALERAALVRGLLQALFGIALARRRGRRRRIVATAAFRTAGRRPLPRGL